MENMRKFYHHEGNQARVRHAKERHDRVNTEVRELMYKMATYILKGLDQGRLFAVAERCALEAGDEVKAANISKVSAHSFLQDDDEITISEATARLLLQKWKLAKLRKD